MWFWSVTGIGAQEALDRLAFLLGPTQLASFLHGPVGQYLQERAKRRFAAEGDDAVGKWEPLQDSTVQMRLSMNYGGEHPINKRTGELENWVVNSGWHAYPQSTGASMAYPGGQPSGILLKKVQTAQGGATNPRTDPRPVLGLSETDLIAFTGMFADYIEEGIR